jgi:hypothetical protein
MAKKPRGARVVTHPFTTVLLASTEVPDLSTKIVFGASVSILAPWVYAALVLIHADDLPNHLSSVFAFVADLSPVQLAAVRAVQPTKFPSVFRLDAPAFDVPFELPSVTIAPFSEFTKAVAQDVHTEFKKKYEVDRPPPTPCL